MRRHGWTALVALVVGCGGGSEEGEDPQTRTSAHADSVEMAARSFDPGVFDTLTWDSPEAAKERGAVVFSFSCQKCHGRRGFGDGRFVLEGDTLKPPSFHQRNWRFAEDPLGLRKMIFTGGEEGMPHWGLHGLKYRDVDAVATFIVDSLRVGG